MNTELDVFNLFVQEAEENTALVPLMILKRVAQRVSPMKMRQVAITLTMPQRNSLIKSTLLKKDEYFWLDQDMTITFGLRYDWYTSDDLPPLNPGLPKCMVFLTNKIWMA